MPAAALAFMIVLVTTYLLGRLSVFVLVMYLVMSVVTFFIYGLDKYAASRRKGRTPERTLHLLALLGGWPGAALAQTLFRHKWKKASFMATFRLISILNAGALIGWLAMR